LHTCCAQYPAEIVRAFRYERARCRLRRDMNGSALGLFLCRGCRLHFMLRPVCSLPAARLSPSRGLGVPRSGRQDLSRNLGPATRRTGADRDRTLTGWRGAARNGGRAWLPRPAGRFVTTHHVRRLPQGRALCGAREGPVTHAWWHVIVAGGSVALAGTPFLVYRVLRISLRSGDCWHARRSSLPSRLRHPHSWARPCSRQRPPRPHHRPRLRSARAWPLRASIDDEQDLGLHPHRLPRPDGGQATLDGARRGDRRQAREPPTGGAGAGHPHRARGRELGADGGDHPA
jgi:hypothetical protein